MSSRCFFAFLLAAVIGPVTARAQDREWEEDYTDTGTEDLGREPVDVQADVDVAPSVTQESFDSGLAPYGTWVSSGRYGRTWRPYVATGWRPYYYGRWEWTNEGWLWVSDEPFGWAVYHYGRWAWDAPWGWVWVPGYQWAPAWVTWRTGGDVVGWAPLWPGLSLYVGAYPFVDFYWTFVPTVQFVSYPVYRAAYAPSYARQNFYRTAPAPARPAPRPGFSARAAPLPAWGGPSPRAIEQRVGRAIRPARVVAAPAPGAPSRPGEVSVYRPGRQASLPAGAWRDRAVDRRQPAMRPAPDSRSSGWAPRPQAQERSAQSREAARAEPRGEARSDGGSRAAPAPSRGQGDGGRAAPAPSRGQGGGSRR